MHLILDNYATHKHAKVLAWLSAANDPMVAFAERIREANKELESGLVTALAFRNAITGAAMAFGAAQLDKLAQAGSFAGLTGQRGKASTIDRALARARKSAALGNLGDAQNQIDYINSFGAGTGVTLEQALGNASMPSAAGIASTNAAKAKSLESEVSELVAELKGISKKLTVS